MEMNISYVRVTALMGKLDDAMVHGTTLPFTGEDIIDIYTILRDYQEQQDTKAGDNLRPQVAAFARLMEAELLKHDDRPGWKECDPQWLIKRLRGEADELAGALLDHSKSVGQEAADVANFAMMIVDVCGELDKDQQTKAGAISEEAAALMDSTAGHRATADLVADPSPGSLSSDDERDALKADYEYKNEQLGAAILRAEKAEAELAEARPLLEAVTYHYENRITENWVIQDEIQKYRAAKEK